VSAPTERNRYDSAGRKTGRQSATGTITSIGYDASGLFRGSETNPLGTTTSDYDLAVGKATEITGADGAVVRTRYDAQSRMVRTIDGAGNDVAATFDVVDRISELTVGGVVRESYRYDDLASHGFGRLHVVSYPAGSQRFGYDLQGRMTSHTFAFDGVASDSTFEFGYDAQGRRTEVTYPDGSVAAQELYDDGVPRRVMG